MEYKNTMGLRIRQDAMRPDEPLKLQSYQSRTDLIPKGGTYAFTSVAMLSIGSFLLYYAFTNNYELSVKITGAALVWFGLAGLERFQNMLSAIWRGRRLRSIFGEYFWTKDHPWDPSGSSSRDVREVIIGMFSGITFLAAFSTPLILAVLGIMPKTAYIIGAISLLAGGFIFYIAGLKGLLQYMKFGRSRLFFNRIPFVLGDSLEASFAPGCSIGRYDKIMFSLRCIQPLHYIPPVRRNSRQRDSDRFQLLYEQTLESIDPGEWYKGEPPFAVRFELPESARPTQISEPVTIAMTRDGYELVEGGQIYWELAVKVECKGLDFDSSFLVPVYSKRQTAG